MICADPLVHASDVEHAVKEEMATSVLDVMRRRTPLALSRCGSPEIAEDGRPPHGAGGQLERCAEAGFTWRIPARLGPPKDAGMIDTVHRLFCLFYQDPCFGMSRVSAMPIRRER